MKILVTGAGGMVGKNLLADPRARDHEILSPSRAELDLTDCAETIDYVASHKPDLIMHFAAVVGGIQANLDNPGRFLSENLSIGLNIVAAARRAGTERFINLGSSCMYPSGSDKPLGPDRLLSGRLEPSSEGYALSKLAAWKLTQAIGHMPGRLWRTIIPPNLYGAYDRFDPVGSHLVPAIILKTDEALRTGRDTITIWGHGRARREFMFAADLADFLWRRHDRLETLPETINVGVGEDHSVDDYYRLVAEVMGYAGGFEHDLARPSGIARKLLDVSAQTELGWSPATPLKEGVAKAVAFYRERGV